MRFDEYLRSGGAVFYQHDAMKLPVGKTIELWVVPGKGLRADMKFLEGDEDAQRVKNAVDQGAINAASVGFRALEHERNEHGGHDITKSELIEWSLTPTPANPNATRVLKSLGLWGERSETVEIVDSAPIADPATIDATMADAVVTACVQALVPQLVRAALAHSDRLIEHAVQRGIARLRGRVLDDDLVVEIADSLPVGRGSGGERFDVTDEHIGHITQQLATRVPGLVAEAVEAGVQRALLYARGRVD
jgi:HK97 family phage prohead protease